MCLPNFGKDMNVRTSKHPMHYTGYDTTNTRHTETEKQYILLWVLSHTHTHTRTHARTQARKHTHKHKHMQTQTNTHTHTHTHTSGVARGHVSRLEVSQVFATPRRLIENVFRHDSVVGGSDYWCYTSINTFNSSFDHSNPSAMILTLEQRTVGKMPGHSQNLCADWCQCWIQFLSTRSGSRCLSTVPKFWDGHWRKVVFTLVAMARCPGTTQT